MNLAVAGAELLRYPVTYAKEVAQVMRLGNEWTNPVVSSPRYTDHTYIGPTGVITEVVQAFQDALTTKGGISINQIKTALEQLKIDIVITSANINTFYANWMAEWYELGKDPKTWSFAKYFWTKFVIPKALEELNHNYFWGIRVTPTPGTAGNSIDSMTGLNKKIDDYITATSLVPIVTGAINSANAVDKIEGFVADLPAAQKKTPGPILASDTICDWYMKNYRASFGTGNGVAGNDNPKLKIDGTNKWLQPMTSMEGSQKLIWSPDLINVRKFGESDFPTPEIHTPIRTLEMSTVFHRAIGFEHLFNTFVNDQA